MSSSFFSEKGKPKFLRYLKLQNVSLNTVKLTFWQHVIFSLQRTCLRYTVPWFVLFLNFSSKKRKQCINIKKGQPLFHCHLVHHGHLFLCSKQLTKCNIHITGLILQQQPVAPKGHLSFIKKVLHLVPWISQIQSIQGSL